MNRQILIITIFHFCCLIILNAQDSIPVKPEHLFGIYTGYRRNIIRDEVASPLIYRGGSAPVLIEYEYNWFSNAPRELFKNIRFVDPGGLKSITL